MWSVLALSDSQFFSQDALNFLLSRWHMSGKNLLFFVGNKSELNLMAFYQMNFNFINLSHEHSLCCWHPFTSFSVICLAFFTNNRIGFCLCIVANSLVRVVTGGGFLGIHLPLSQGIPLDGGISHRVGVGVYLETRPWFRNRPIIVALKFCVHSYPQKLL